MATMGRLGTSHASSDAKGRSTALMGSAFIFSSDSMGANSTAPENAPGI